MKALDAFLANTFICVDNRGRLVNKSQYIKEIGGGSTQSREIVNEDLLVHMYGDVAVAISTHANGLRHGKGVRGARGLYRHLVAD